MDFLKFSNASVAALVEQRPILWDHTKRTVFVTISPNAKTQHICIKPFNGKMKEFKMPYGMMQQRLQYAYCIRYLKSCYLSFLDGNVKLVGTWELNKEGNVHLHMLIQADNLQTDIALQIFRRDIYSCTQTILNMGTIKKKHTVPIDWMNSIVYTTDSIQKRLDYMDKDHDKTFDNFYYIATTGDQGGSASGTSGE